MTLSTNTSLTKNESRVEEEPVSYPGWVGDRH